MRSWLPLALFFLSIIGWVDGDQPIKCGWSDHTLRPYLARQAVLRARPVRQATYLSADGAFMVHYDTTGTHRPDLTSHQPDGTPDWVVEVAAALSWSRYLLIDSLGFDSAPDDGDGRYDVYLTQLGWQGLYGQTLPETYLGDDRWTSYMEMDNDFSPEEPYNTVGLYAARVTAAHEYFHAVHLGYGLKWEDLFFYEFSSTWFEEVAFPESNDWFYYYPSFANNPTQPIYTEPPAGGYSIALFGHYLARVYDIDIMREAWQQFKHADALTSLTGAIAAFGGNLTAAWTDFVARLFFNRAAPQYYFHPDQDSLDIPVTGPAYVLRDSLRINMDDLEPGKVDIKTVRPARPLGIQLHVYRAPALYASKVVFNGPALSLHNLSRDEWYASGLDSTGSLTLIVGAERDSVMIIACYEDIQVAINQLYPNPIQPGRQSAMTIDYTVAQGLPGQGTVMVVYNLLGQELYRLDLGPSIDGRTHTMFLPSGIMQQWPSGIYILQLNAGGTHSPGRVFTLIH